MGLVVCVRGGRVVNHETKKPTTQFGLMRIERCDACDGFYHAIEGHVCPQGEHATPAATAPTRDRWASERQVKCLRCGALMAIVPPEEQYGFFPWCPPCWAKKTTRTGLPVHPHWATPGPVETEAMQRTHRR